MVSNNNIYRRRILRAIIILVIFFLIGGASATTLTVDDSGGADHKRIQDAINVASDGDTILVYSGTYSEYVNINKRLVLRGIDNGGGKPVVNAGGRDSAVTLSAGWSTIEGFTVTNSGMFGWYKDDGIKVVSNNNIIKNTNVLNSQDGISLYYSNNNILNGNAVLNNNLDGIWMENSNNNTLSDNTASNNKDGIAMRNSNNNTLNSNAVSNNNENGIWMENSNNNVLSGNTASNNKDPGIWMENSNNNVLSSNTVSSNGGGVGFSNSSNNTLNGNAVSNNNESGIWIENSNNNVLSGNTVSSNGGGVGFSNSSNNRVHHNNIINNYAYDDAINIWDNGLSGGNYWSDYTGTDANNDGIGDTPYVISSMAKDSYPLMTPYKEPTPLLTPTSTPSGGWIQNPANGHYYKLTTSLQWLQAEVQAVNWGGHLVTINDRQEELWLRNQFGSNELFWMGFNDVNVEGRWGWVSFEPVNYTNWWAGEPNDMSGEGKSEDAAVMNWGGFEKINGTGITYYGDGWNDIPIEIYTRGIVEISTSTPLPTPTPTPMKGTIIVTSTGGVIRSISPSIIGTIITVLAIFLIFLAVVYSNRIKDEKLIIQRIDELVLRIKTKKLDNNELRAKLIEINKDVSHKESYGTSYKGYFFAVALVLSVLLLLGYLTLAPEATEAPINMKSISTPAPTPKATPNITHTPTVTPTKTTTATPVRLKVVEDVFNGDASAANKAGLEKFENGYYYVVDWQGDKYVALKGKTTKLVKLILEQRNGENKVLAVGETWNIGGSWTVTAISIDAKASPGQVWLVLSKGGIKKDDRVIAQGGVYTYVEKSIGGESDVPLFVTCIARVYAGATSDKVQLSYTWAVDTTTITIPK